jgi:hypothetical protein
MHGYGYAIPTGIGVGFDCANFLGPWLLPALRNKGWQDQQVQRSVVATLIDRFNDMLDSLQSQYNDIFFHIDLRQMIAPQDWVNELHLKPYKVEDVAMRIATTFEPYL